MSLLDTASLIVTPNAYKEGKLYSVIPSDGSGDLSVTRATTATRVNAAGLVELVPYNLFQYSEQFDNVAWNKSGTISTNSTIAPNGTLTADTITIPSAATAQYYIIRSSFFINVGQYTQSFYVKKNTYGYIALVTTFNGALTTSYFDINTGVVGPTTAGTTSSITDVGNGWYRVTQTATETIGANRVTGIYFANSLMNSINVSLSLTDSFYVWGAQLVEGTEAKDYFATETRLNIPRLDYSLGSCPSILVEPQRTNLVTYSEQFDNAAWTKSTTTITPNTTISPSGLMTADTMEVSGTLSRVISANVLTAGTYTISVWAKALSGSGAMRFSLTIDGVTTAFSFTPTTEWQRFTQTFTATISVTTISFRGFGFVGDLAIWGAQLEAGAYPTSYIPTTSASVTRNADELTRGNVYTNNWITASGGTLFVDLKNNIDIARNGSSGGIFLNTGTLSLAGDGFLFRNANSSSQKINIVKYISGTATTLYYTLTENVKAAIKWNGTNADVFVNGVKVVSATAFTITAMQNLIAQGSNRNLNINAMALWPTPLTDDELTALTTI